MLTGLKYKIVATKCGSLLRKYETFNFSNKFSQAVAEKCAIEQDSMLAWQIDSYGDESKLHLSRNVERPRITSADQVIVKVQAASVNPLDLEMLSGFGSVLLKNMRQIGSCYQDCTSDLPLILGRDFAGVVTLKGGNVRNVEIGDKVYGVVPPQNQGCFSQYALTDRHLIVRRPPFLSVSEASCILYTGITAWCALKISGGLGITGAKGKRVLVIGSSGGVGVSAVQLLNYWGAEVTAVCSKEAAPVTVALLPEHIVDYTQPNFMEKLDSFGKFDLILDAAGLGEEKLRPYIPLLQSCGSIITLHSPLLPNIDTYGLVRGAMKSAVDIIVPNITSGIMKKCGLMKWAFFMPLSSAVSEIEKLVAAEKVISIVEKSYSFTELPAAFERMRSGHIHGKLVVHIDHGEA